MANQPITYPRRGEVWLVDFDPTVGAEIRKTRPALVIQNDVGNRLSPIVIVAVITSKFDEEVYPTEVVIEPPERGLSVSSVVQLNQIRSVDKRRLVRRLGKVGPDTMRRVDRAILISLGIGLDRL